jgi:hypothetical protein
VAFLFVVNLGGNTQKIHAVALHLPAPRRRTQRPRRATPRPGRHRPMDFPGLVLEGRDRAYVAQASVVYRRQLRRQA